MFTHMTVGKVTLLAALVGVCVVGFATMTSAEEVHEKVFREVMRECHVKDIGDEIFFVILPGKMGKAGTDAEIETYVKSKLNYVQATSDKVKCWTFERWQKYARSILKEQQRAAIKAGELPK